jgi:hypothetical protein
MSDDVSKIAPELLAEQAYLVARGVREIADVGTVSADPDSMLRATTVLESAAQGAIAFVFPSHDGRAVCGFAGHRWSLELFKWVVTADLPPEHRASILGLLHGYAGAAVRDYDEQGCGRAPPTSSDAPASS